jgi:hypothetical protein
VKVLKGHMKNFPRLFVLCQELTNTQKKRKGSMENLKNKKRFLALDRLIALHGNPAIVNDEWTISVWNGVAVEKGMDHTQISF